MANYSISNQNAGTQQAIATAYKTLASMFGAATPNRGKLYDFMIGTDGTPADNAMDFDVSRMTVDGTGTANTPLPLDPADAASTTTAKTNYTAEPTVTANSSMFFLGLNQRASYRWVCAPGSEILWPATTANGLVIRAKSAGYTGTATVTALYQDQ